MGKEDNSHIRSNLLSKYAHIKHGFGLGDFSLDDHLRPLAFAKARYFQTNQMHGEKIVTLSSRNTDAKKVIEADAFITDEKGVICFVRTADCVPILLCDTKKPVVAAVHAGWRGTLLGIVANTVEQMVSVYGSKKEDIVAAIGPAISASCFEVGKEVAEQFETQHKSRMREQAGRIFIDLQGVNKDILAATMIKDIEVINICNHCDMRFASYRRDRDEKRRQVNFIYSCP